MEQNKTFDSVPPSGLKEQIKIIEAVPTSILEQFVNNWLKVNREHIIVFDIKFVCGEYGRHFVMIHYNELEEE